uniref:Uncharacterized protein n=1 Tax=Arundo donax TaxID=35708 RepID=A0A0A8ZKN6_ARUDO
MYHGYYYVTMLHRLVASRYLSDSSSYLCLVHFHGHLHCHLSLATPLHRRQYPQLRHTTHILADPPSGNHPCHPQYLAADRLLHGPAPHNHLLHGPAPNHHLLLRLHLLVVVQLDLLHAVQLHQHEVHSDL